jgi:hypothetical protein
MCDRKIKQRYITNSCENMLVLSRPQNILKLKVSLKLTFLLQTDKLAKSQPHSSFAYVA